MTSFLSIDQFVAAVREGDFQELIQDDVRVNQGYLYGDFIDHPEKFQKWATLYEMAVDMESRLKNELQRMYAHCDKHTRDELKMSGIKYTEKMVENTVITHPKYLEVQEEYHDAKLISGLLKAARDAMIHRRDMLIQLGATARAEGSADISIREDAAKRIVGRNQ